MDIKQGIKKAENCLQRVAGVIAGLIGICKGSIMVIDIFNNNKKEGENYDQFPDKQF